MSQDPIHYNPPAIGPRPFHPGVTISEDWLKPLGMSMAELARRLSVSQQLINQIVRGEAPITARTALRLERLFGPSAAFWLKLQQGWDLWHEARASRAALKRIKRIKWDHSSE